MIGVNEGRGRRGAISHTNAGVLLLLQVLACMSVCVHFT
jgi:hypothetical protein